MSQHHFDIEIAQQYGLNEAIFLNHLSFWITKNAANNLNYYENSCWSYNTQKSFELIFPYWSRQNIRTIIKSCINKNLIRQGNFNKKGYDRTAWYSFTQKGLLLYPHLKPAWVANGWNQPMEWLESTNGLVGINQAIPVNNTVNNTYILKQGDLSIADKPKKDLAPTPSEITQNNPHNIPQDLIDEWIANRKRKKAAITPKVWELLNNELSKCYNPLQAFKDMVLGGWQSLKAEWVNSNATQSVKPTTPSRKCNDTKGIKDYDREAINWADGVLGDMF